MKVILLKFHLLILWAFDNHRLDSQLLSLGKSGDIKLLSSPPRYFFALESVLEAKANFAQDANEWLSGKHECTGCPNKFTSAVVGGSAKKLNGFWMPNNAHLTYLIGHPN